MNTPTDLRERLIDMIADRLFRTRGQAAEHADALIAGPLKELIAERDELEVKLSWSQARTNIVHEHMDWWRGKGQAAEAEASSLRDRVSTLEWHLRECINQLEYQHEKFGGTGSGDTVMFRARLALTPTEEPASDAR